jgi:hypothetical protein
MQEPEMSGPRVWTQEEIDAEVETCGDDDDYDGELSYPGEECRRWSNGRLGPYCSKAGSEECDWECPYRDSECVKC